MCKMSVTFWCHLCLWLLLHYVAAEDKYYTAAVVEHAPTRSDTPKDTMLQNINFYRDQVSEARRRKSDIIVFPEYGLTTIIYDRHEEYAIVIPEDINDSDDKVLRDLSNMAKEYNIYLVVNLLEKAYDLMNQTIMYNTDLVFNRDGRIHAKYRKINLFNEDKLTPGNETVFFSTDFGVTFGLITCFDILFQTPARDIFDNQQVTDVIFSTAWFSTLPFYSALSVQHGYVLANGINLLASNYNDPKNANGGSGIYTADGNVLDKYIGTIRSSKVLVGSVTKISKRLRTDNSCPDNGLQAGPSRRPKGALGAIPGERTSIADFITHYDFKKSDYKFKTLDMKDTQFSTTETICDGWFCCTFNITVASPAENEYYKFVAFDGRTMLDRSLKHVRICALLACETDDPDSCGKRIEPATEFGSIDVFGNLPSKNTTYTPVTLLSNLEYIDSTNYCNRPNENQTAFVYLGNPHVQAGVITFGLYGMVSSAPNIVMSLMLGLLISIFKYFM